MSARIVLLPLPPVPESEIPEGMKIVKFDTLYVQHPHIIGAYTPLRILVPDDPDPKDKMGEIGRIATATGQRFRNAMELGR